MRVADLEILPVIGSEVDHDPSLENKMSPEVRKSHKAPLTPDGKLVAAMGGFLIRNGTNDRGALADDQWEGFADVGSLAAKAAKNTPAGEVEDAPVAATHFAGHQFGRLLQGEPRRRFAF